MPVDIGSPAPRTTLIGRDARGGPVYGDKAYIDFWLALARAAGGPGRVATVAEVAQAAADAMDAAAAAQGVATAAAESADQALMDAGDAMRVARNIVIPEPVASGGLAFNDEGIVLGRNVFGD